MSLEENHLSGLLSPFGKKKYQIPEPRNIKKALNIGEIKLLYEYKADELSPEQLYHDLWFFSYLCNGMNMKDICLLRHKNIDGDHIYFNREKTRNSNRDSKPIDVFIIDEIRIILKRWATKTDNEKDFVFPFLNQEMDYKIIRAKVSQVTKMTNKYIRRIAVKVGIDKKITSYWARHSYATVLKRANVGTEFISEQLGHKSLKTTESYLDSFEDDTKKEIANQLLNFKK
jgi:integrase